MWDQVHCIQIYDVLESYRLYEPDVVQRFLGDLPKAQLELIKDCKHIPHVKKPKHFSSILKEFYLQENKSKV